MATEETPVGRLAVGPSSRVTGSLARTVTGANKTRVVPGSHSSGVTGSQSRGVTGSQSSEVTGSLIWREGDVEGMGCIVERPSSLTAQDMVSRAQERSKWMMADTTETVTSLLFVTL